MRDCCVCAVYKKQSVVNRFLFPMSSRKNTCTERPRVTLENRTFQKNRNISQTQTTLRELAEQTFHGQRRAHPLVSIKRQNIWTNQAQISCGDSFHIFTDSESRLCVELACRFLESPVKSFLRKFHLNFVVKFRLKKAFDSKAESSKHFGLPNNLTKTFESNAFFQSKLHYKISIEFSQKGLARDF